MPRATPVAVEALNEPIWLLRSLPYTSYRNSIWWRRRRDLYVSDFVTRWGQKACEICACTSAQSRCGTGRVAIQYHVHHVSYDAIGNEPDSHLALVCSMCHNAIHYPESNAANFWIEKLREFGVDFVSSHQNIKERAA